jgi:hypothetical protein
MSFKQAFASILYLFVVSSFFLLGILCMGLSYIPSIQMSALDLLSRHAGELTWVGAGLIALSVLLFLGFNAINPGHYLRFKMGDNAVKIDRKVVRKAVEEVFRGKKIALRDIDVVAGKQLEFGVEVNEPDDEEREQLLLDIEKDLQALLQKRFGYTKPFYLVVKI